MTIQNFETSNHSHHHHHEEEEEEEEYRSRLNNNVVDWRKQPSVSYRSRRRNEGHFWLVRALEFSVMVSALALVLIPASGSSFSLGPSAAAASNRHMCNDSVDTANKRPPSFLPRMPLHMIPTETATTAATVSITSSDRLSTEEEEEETRQDDVGRNSKEGRTVKQQNKEQHSKPDAELQTRAAVARNLLSHKRLSHNRGGKSGKSISRRTHTSVGPIKGKKRKGGHISTACGKILSAVTTTAAVAASITTTHDKKVVDPKTKEGKSSSIIQSTIHDILHRQEESRYNNSPENNAASLPPPNSMGLFGERPPSPPMSKPFPGTTLIPPSCPFLSSSLSSDDDNNKDNSMVRDTTTTTTTPTPIRDAITVRVATRLDDYIIANLRLSVFANFITKRIGNKEDPIHHKFRMRSCQVLDSRRNKGAICLVASIPKVFRGDAIAISRNKRRGWLTMSQFFASWDSNLDFWGKLEEWEREEEWIMGSAECSVHEFYGTSLGSERKEGQILYITEVAVSPEARMIGIGKKLLEGIDELARIRNVETLYLHVDVTNNAAIRLYENAGYSVVESNKVHDEFTTSLNLHDGAMNGRSHFLLCKNLKTPTILKSRCGDDDCAKDKEGNVLGFEVTV